MAKKNWIGRENNMGVQMQTTKQWNTEEDILQNCEATPFEEVKSCFF